LDTVFHYGTGKTGNFFCGKEVLNMSKSLVIKNNRFRNKIKNFFKPKDPFMKVFGATDAFLSYSKDISKLSFATTGVGFGSSLGVPLPPALPLGKSAFEPVYEKVAVKSDEFLLPEKTEIPVLNPELDQKERNDQANNTGELDDLLGLLDKSGFKVDEVKALPSGVTRITVNDLFGMKHDREPEFIRVRG
jgi:hypothetical protein